MTDALNLHSRMVCSLDESIRFITPIVSSVLNTKVSHTVLELETQRQILVAFCLHLFADPRLFALIDNNVDNKAYSRLCQHLVDIILACECPILTLILTHRVREKMRQCTTLCETKSQSEVMTWLDLDIPYLRPWCQSSHQSLTESRSMCDMENWNDVGIGHLLVHVLHPAYKGISSTLLQHGLSSSHIKTSSSGPVYDLFLITPYVIDFFNRTTESVRQKERVLS